MIPFKFTEWKKEEAKEEEAKESKVEETKKIYEENNSSYNNNNSNLLPLIDLSPTKYIDSNHLNQGIDSNDSVDLNYRKLHDLLKNSKREKKIKKQKNNNFGFNYKILLLIAVGVGIGILSKDIRNGSAANQRLWG